MTGMKRESMVSSLEIGVSGVHDGLRDRSRSPSPLNSEAGLHSSRNELVDDTAFAIERCPIRRSGGKWRSSGSVKPVSRMGPSREGGLSSPAAWDKGRNSDRGSRNGFCVSDRSSREDHGSASCIAICVASASWGRYCGARPKRCLQARDCSHTGRDSASLLKSPPRGVSHVRVDSDCCISSC